MSTEDIARTIEITVPISLKNFFEGKAIEKETAAADIHAKLQPRKIEIPRIQRSYAQGRVPSANEKRHRFLEAIHDYMASGKPMTLDFVYGNIEENKLIPLDGQQRLTTLFLLHWYASRHAGEKARAHVMFKPEQFNYMTRYSSRDFLIRLVDFQPCLTQGHMSISEQIKKEQGWFAVEWEKDPTIASMLVMLDAIDERFADIATDLWSRLDNIDFYMLDVTSMNQTDDIYVRMNSRGRELTDFEHFKVELLKTLKDSGIDEETEERISLKIDMDWTAMLWKYKDENYLVDSAFLRLFRFVCMLISYRDRKESFTQKKEEYNLVKDYFAIDKSEDDTEETIKLKRETVFRNLALLEKIFDIWTNIPDIDDFFAEYIEPTGHGHQPGKVLDCWLSDRRLSGDTDRDRYSWRNPLKSWLHSSTNAYRLFAVLYIFTVVLEKNPTLIGTDYFRRRLRIMSNMIKNSSDREITDSPGSDAGNRMPTILRQIEEVMLQPGFEILPASLNQVVMEEEKEKWSYTTDKLSLSAAEEIFCLEDHKLLDGMVGVVDYTRPDRFVTFETLFDNCTRSNVEQALLAQGDCTISSGGDYRRIATVWDRVWYEFFRSLYKDFRGNDKNKESRDIFRNFLDAVQNPTDSMLSQKTADYISLCQQSGCYDWRYYYLKYSPFRRERFGLITLDPESPFSSFMTHFTQKQESNNSQQPFLKTILGGQYQKSDNSDLLRRQPYSAPIVTSLTGINGAWLTCANDSWELYPSEESLEPIFRLPVPQSNPRIDTVDRIDYLLNAPASAWQPIDQRATSEGSPLPA